MIRIMSMGQVPAEEIFNRNIPTSNVSETVAEIIREVRTRGDSALRDYTAKFDGAVLDSLIVSRPIVANSTAGKFAIPL